MELKQINHLPQTKDEMKTYSKSIINEVVEGNINPAELICRLKPIIDSFDEVKKYISDYVLKEIAKSGGKFNYNSIQIEQMEAGTKYDYTSCNDSVYTDLALQMEELKDKIKVRELFLKSIGIDGQTIVVEETGEIVKIYPPLKTSTTTFKTTYK